MSTPKTNFLNIAKNVVEAKKQPSLTLDETNILLETDGIHALKQSIRRMLTTERFIYTIYDHRYGVELDVFIWWRYGLCPDGYCTTHKRSFV